MIYCCNLNGVAFTRSILWENKNTINLCGERISRMPARLIDRYDHVPVTKENRM